MTIDAHEIGRHAHAALAPQGPLRASTSPADAAIRGKNFAGGCADRFGVRPWLNRKVRVDHAALALERGHHEAAVASLHKLLAESDERRTVHIRNSGDSGPETTGATLNVSGC